MNTLRRPAPGLACIDFATIDDATEFLHICQKPYRPSLETWDECEDDKHRIAMRLLARFPTAKFDNLTTKFRSQQEYTNGATQ
jgi:hypothetical protein